MDKVSVVTVCYNAKDEIVPTIQSVLSQDYKNIEYVLVDGASKDGTVDILEKYRKEAGKHPNIEWKQVSEPDKGIYDAMNKGTALATGEWIIFMNAGDCFVKNTTVANMFSDDHKGYDGIFGDTIRVKNSKRLYVEGRDLENIKDEIPLPFCHQSVFVRKSRLIEHPYNLKYKQAGDYNLFCELYLEGCKFVHVKEPVSLYAMGGISEINNIRHLKEKIEIRERLGLEHYSDLKKIYMVNRLRLRRSVKKIIPNRVLNKLQGFE